jgi:hypothetical protein
MRQGRVDNGGLFKDREDQTEHTRQAMAKAGKSCLEKIGRDWIDKRRQDRRGQHKTNRADKLNAFYSPPGKISLSAVTITPLATISVHRLTSPPKGGSLILAINVDTLITPRNFMVSSRSPKGVVGSSTWSSSTEKKYDCAAFLASSLDSIRMLGQ